MEDNNNKREGQKRKVFFSLGAKEWFVALFVALLTFIVFLPALSNDFVNWDDNIYVYENNHIRSLDLKLFKWIFQFQASNWHPLTWLSHAIDYSLWGLNPVGHHASSIIIHSINIFLLSILVSFLLLHLYSNKLPLSQPNERYFDKSLVASGVTALLFGIHPLRVESVVWVAERKDVLCTFFILLSLISYVIYALRLRTNKNLLYYILSLIFFVLALMSKPMAVTIPFVLILLDVYPLKRMNLRKVITSQKKVFIEKIPFLFFSILSVVLTLMAQHSEGAIKSFHAYPLLTQIGLALKGLFFYLEKIILPIRLSAFYPYPKVISFFSLEYLFALIAVLFITVFSITAWKKDRKIFMAIWVYFVITLLPVLGIIKIGDQSAADRYTYMPSIGPFLLVGIGISLLWEKTYSRDRLFFLNKKIIILALVLIFSVMSVLTIKQIKVWRNSITLWTLVLKRYPDYVHGYLSLANAYMTLNRYDKALRTLDSAVTVDPSIPGVYNMRGLVHESIGNYKSSLEEFSKAIELDPEYAAAYSNRAELYIRLREYQKSFQDLDKAIELDPDDTTYYLNRCEVNKLLTRYKEAIKDCSRAVEVDPEDARAYYSRGLAFYALGKYSEAISDYDTSLALDQHNPKGYFHRGLAYKDKGEYQEAIQNFSEAIALRPDFTDALINRGVSYGEMSNLDKAIEDFTMSIVINPRDANSYYNRGAAYYRMGKEEDALRDFQKASKLGDEKTQEFLNKNGIQW